jgi:hypothetical protein
MTSEFIERPVAKVLAIFVALAAVGTADAQSPTAKAPPADARAVSARPASTIDTATRKAIITQLAKLLRDRYVDPEVGAKAADRLERAEAAGAYDAVTTSEALAARLTSDVAEIAHDKHLRVSGPPIAGRGAPPAPPPRAEAGVARADRLPGNIGYIELVSFPPPEAFKLALDRAMAALADTRALVIDLRRNGGGSAGGVAYLSSFFVDPKSPIHLNDIVWRNTGTSTFRTDVFNSVPTPTSYLGKPVYVLVSGRTFSGGEGSAYELQVRKIAVVVGEATGGGANPGGGVGLGGGFSVFMPAGKARNPLTQTNWEGVGVKPDVAVPASDALKATLERLGVKAAVGEVDALSQASLFTIRNTPELGTEAALRRLIAGLAGGEPDYASMSPAFAEATRNQLEQIRTMLAQQGAVQSVSFRQPSPAGGDAFDVKFANGSGVWGISLDANAKIVGAGIMAVVVDPPAAHAP